MRAFNLPCPPDTPLGQEILALARSEDPQDRERLFQLLDDAGAEIDVPDQGEVAIGGRSCEFSFTHQVLEVEGVLDETFCRDVIELAESKGVWSDSTQVRGGGPVYQDENRTSQYQRLRDICFPDYADHLQQRLIEVAKFYQARNKYLVFKEQEISWELLRYQPGDKFETHVDMIANSSWKARTLTLLAYLNDDFSGGETEFVKPGPEVTVQPKRGKAIASPPFWTHPHRGCPPTSGSKYVVLGWLYA